MPAGQTSHLSIMSLPLLLLLTLLPRRYHGNTTSPHTHTHTRCHCYCQNPAPTNPAPRHRRRFVLSAPMFVYFVCMCPCITCSPSGSQSFFSARHMGALIRRFLPLERTVVALARHADTAVESSVFLKDNFSGSHFEEVCKQCSTDVYGIR